MEVKETAVQKLVFYFVVLPSGSLELFLLNRLTEKEREDPTQETFGKRRISLREVCVIPSHIS